MDSRYSLGFSISLLRACSHEDGSDLIAVAGEGVIEILRTRRMSK